MWESPQKRPPLNQAFKGKINLWYDPDMWRTAGLTELAHKSQYYD